MSGVLTRRRTNDGGVTVRYTPCAKSERTDLDLPAPEEEDEEDEHDAISILSPADDGGGGGGLQEGGPGRVSAPSSNFSVVAAGGGGSGGSCSSSGSSGSGSRRRAAGYRVGIANRAVAGDGFEDYIEDFDGASDSRSRQEALVSGQGQVPSVDFELTESRPLHSEGIVASVCGVGKREPIAKEDSTKVGNDLAGNRATSASSADSTSAGPSAVAFGACSTSQTPTANGPRHLPGLDLFPGTSDRTKLIGERLSSADKISLSSPIYSNKVVEQRSKSQSRQSLLEVFSNKLDRVKNRKRFSIAQGSLLKKPRLSEANININRVQRRQRRKDIEEKFGKRKSIRGDRLETATTVSSEHEGCNWTFVFDPSGRLCYWWSSVVSVAFLYNFWVIIYRYAFQEISAENIAVWFTLDYTADLLYVLDIAFHFRTEYREDGVLQTDPVKLRIHYTNTTTFYIDCLCLLPLDFLYLSIGFCSILRGFRLVKVYRFWAFLDRTERHTNYPNVIRATTLMHYVIALFHWNACLYYIVALRLDRLQEKWRFPKEEGSVALKYLHALHWSLITLTTIGTPPVPRTIGEYLFVIFELIFALVLFATFLGHIANIVTNVSAARKEFQARLDAVKTYMNLRRVPLKLQDRVIKWFDYLWMCNKSTDEDKALSLLPDKLKAEIAIHVHLDTLKRVEIFQNTEAGFLCELVLRLRPVLFSPGDYICRNGEVGKEMYIVNRGRLHVVADNGKTVLATLKPGSYFGEISILNMGTAGNRRTASVRSVGYSDLFCLAKKDLWDVLKEYPAARVKLEAIAVKRLAKYKKQPIEKALERSKSTPGLVESTGKVPLDAMLVQRHHTLPAGLLSSTGAHSTDPGDVAEAERLRKLESTQSEDNLLSRCVEKSERRLSSDSQAGGQVVCNMTTSMTISSITSYNGTPPLRSPATTIETTKSSFTPPSSPKQMLQSTVVSSLQQQALHHQQHMQQPYPTHVSNISGVSPLLGGDQRQLTPMHPSQQQISFPPFPHSSFPYVNSPHVPAMTYLSPFSAALTYPPSPTPGIHAPHVQVSQGALAVAAAPHLGSSQTSLFSHAPFPGAMVQTPTGTLLPPSHSPHAVSPLMAPPGASPLSLGSPARGENQADILLKEISRLRERLAQLEGENTALTVKLNQQQWDVENRLMELELHLGQSDSVASTDVSDDRFVTSAGGSSAVDRYGGERSAGLPSVHATVVNKESII